MIFKLEIESGNAAMRTADDVSRALVKLSRHLHQRDWDNFEGVIMDDNGNKVGSWTLEDAVVGDENDDG